MREASDTLRRAARVLREHAGATRPGVWIGSQDVRREANAAGHTHGSRLSVGDTHWIALMTPAVGLALADWLDSLVTSYRPTAHALAVARTILREDVDDA